MPVKTVPEVPPVDKVTTALTDDQVNQALKVHQVRKAHKDHPEKPVNAVLLANQVKTDETVPEVNPVLQVPTVQSVQPV